MVSELRLPCLEIAQGKDRLLYSFAVDGKVLPQFTTISRIRRTHQAVIQGYQRPEVRSHITEIKSYLESDNPLIPNAIVVAFDSRVRFEADPNQNGALGFARTGTLVIPIDDDTPDQDKPGWIVDGQQRVAAIREADILYFPICVNAFIAQNDKEQREQFILVNSTKPLPKGLIYELLPTTEAHLPTLLQRRRFPAYLSDRLNHDEDSPFVGLICTPTTQEGIVKDNSILKMLENSLSDGALNRFRDPATGGGEAEKMLQLVKAYWSAVAAVFPDSWGQNPRRSRLMHGAGIVSLGFVMDAISDRYRRDGIPTKEQFVAELTPLRDYCSWSSGYWEFGPGTQRKWNELQNTSKDIQLLANFLLVQYKQKVWSKVS